MSFSSLWNGSLEFPPKRLPKVGRNEDHIERAAAFLAGDMFGRLKYAQAIAFLTNRKLVDAVDSFHLQNLPLSRDNILLLSRLLSVKGVLVPERSTGGTDS